MKIKLEILIISLFLHFFHLQAQQKQLFNFPLTSIVITIPEHFIPKQDNNGAYYIYHPGTNAIIQAIESSLIWWHEQKKLYNEEYFYNQKLFVVNVEEKTLSNGIELILFECNTEYKSNHTDEIVPYKVFLLAGGKDQTTFLLVARYPQIADNLLKLVIKETLFSVQLKK